MPLEVTIVTPVGETATLECDEVVAPGALGDIGVLPSHIPLMAVLRPGVLSTIVHARDHTIGILMGTAETHYVVGRGYLEVSDDVVTVLASTCERVEDIDVERARRSLEHAEAELAKLEVGSPGHTAAAARRERAQARLTGAGRR